MRSLLRSSAAAAAFLLLALPGCAEKSGSVPEVPDTELQTQVPELDAIHEEMSPLWHEAFPAKDYAAIQALVPLFEPKLAALEAVKLPGILQDKEPRWAEQKALLMEAFTGLKSAAEAGDQEAMLGFAETFHMNYEGLVRIVRPVVPELDAFHQELYGLYHYYGPGYDLEKIQRAADAMAEKVVPLKAAQLPERLAEHQGHFEMLVTTLGEKVAALQAVLQDPSREAVTAAMEEVHVAYEAVEKMFE